MALTFPGGLGRVNAETSSIDTFAGMASSFSTVPASREITVDTDTQLAVFASLTVTGQLSVKGELRVVNWPS